MSGPETTGTPAYRVWALPGIPEVRAGDDLAKLIAATGPGLVDGDVLLVTSKIVSKAEGRIVEATDREAAIDAETVRVVARRGTLRIVENRQGLVMAAAGVDASNTPAGTVLLLPEDPDASALAIRDGLRDALGVEVGVLVTDTFGRPWRNGLTDVAIGAAGSGSWTTCAAARTATAIRSAPPWSPRPTSWPRPVTWSRGRPPVCPSPWSGVCPMWWPPPGRPTPLAGRGPWCGSRRTTCSGWAPPRPCGRR